MIIKGVDFPEDLLRAQAEGNLVIFAGAGVSCPPPSSLPLFTGLATRIGSASGRQREEHEPEDRYLGRLKKAGVQVHNAAAGILVHERTKPTELHRYLLQLFPAGDKVRLVTTNFDTHFSTISSELYEDKIETFYAPALPLGDDFEGLIYLHGSAGKEPKRCVLTDEDFGRAYLTQAWASRFLAAMFSRYVVLFVGYSHNDTVMNYLARGLPPVARSPRFALTTGDEQSVAKWEFLGIRPLIYKMSQEENPHNAITISIGEWVAESSRGLLEKAQRIRSIVEAQPPLEGEDTDYIKYSLGEKSTWQLFFKYARRPEWISWLETHDFLKEVFDWHGNVNEFDHQLALWLTEHFLFKHSSELMAAIQRNQTRIHARLAWCIWRRLCHRENELAGDVFAKWILVLLTQPRHLLRYDDWCSLLHGCRFPQDRLASVILFDFVTKPAILLKEPWHIFQDHAGDEKVEFDLNLSSEEEHSLSESWEQLLLPNIAAYAASLFPVVTANLAAAHNLLQICGRARPDRDPFRVHRQSIEHAEKHGFPHAFDVLVHAAKAIVDHFLQEKPQHVATLIELWLASEAAILRRLAIYAYGLRSDVAADRKVGWILECSFIYTFKTDVFEFLGRCYASASKDAKQALIDRILDGPDERLEARTREYEVYNFIVWLHRISPECEIAGGIFERLQREHQDFAPRDNPELDFSNGGVQTVNPAEGFDIDLIISKPAQEFLNQFLSFKPRDPLDYRDPSSVVSAAVARSPNWGLDWVQELIARGLSDQRLWYCVCQGWNNAALSADQWAAVLEVAATIEAPSEFYSAFAENLENGSRREQNRLPDELMNQAQRVAERIWERALSLTRGEMASEDEWLTAAINSPGGHLAQFWIQRISVARKTAGESWKELPAATANCVAEILRSSARAAVHARIVFASQIHYIFHLDPGFAERELLPLFDWNANSLKAEQCWHGYLWRARWLPGLTGLLLPYFDQTLTRLDKMPDDLRRQTISHIAGLVLFRFENPMESDWLPKTAVKLSSSDLEHFASEIDRFLDDTETSIVAETWDRWLKSYWEMRLLGTPKPMSKKEATEIVYWSLSLGQRLPNALELIQKMSGAVKFEHPDIFYRIEKKGIATSQPLATAELLLFFFNSAPEYFYPSDHVENVWRAIKAAGVPAVLLKKLREAMVAFGHDPEHES